VEAESEDVLWTVESVAVEAVAVESVAVESVAVEAVAVEAVAVEAVAVEFVVLVTSVDCVDVSPDDRLTGTVVSFEPEVVDGEVSSPLPVDGGADPDDAEPLLDDAGGETTGGEETGADPPPPLSVDAGGATTGTGGAGADPPSPPPVEVVAGGVVGPLPELVPDTGGGWPPWEIVGDVGGPPVVPPGELVDVVDVNEGSDGVCSVPVNVTDGAEATSDGGGFAGDDDPGRGVPTIAGGADNGCRVGCTTEPATWEAPSATAAVASIFATTPVAPRPLTLATVSPPETAATEPPATATPAAPVVTLARPPVAAAPTPTLPTVAPPPTTTPVLAVVTPAVTPAPAAAAPPPAAAAPPLVTPAPATAAPPPVTPAPVAAAPPAPAVAPAASAPLWSTAPNTVDFRPTARGTGTIRASAARW
jgi:hypothetical protein